MVRIGMVSVPAEETVTVQGMDSIMMSSLKQMVQTVKFLHPDLQERPDRDILSCQLLEAERIGRIAFKMVLVDIDADTYVRTCQAGSI